MAREKDMDYEGKIYNTRDMKGIATTTEDKGSKAPGVNRSMKKSTKVYSHLNIIEIFIVI